MGISEVVPNFVNVIDLLPTITTTFMPTEYSTTVAPLGGVNNATYTVLPIRRETSYWAAARLLFSASFWWTVTAVIVAT
jgi:hypothetical protein